MIKPKTNRYNIKSEKQLTVVARFAKAMKEGKELPLVNIQSPNVLFSQMDADKTLTTMDKKLMLTRILESNRRKIEEKKISIERLRLKKKEKFKNFDGGYQHIYTAAEIAAQEAAVTAALTEKTRLQAKHNSDLLNYSMAEKKYFECKRKYLCNVHKNNVLSSYTSWRDAVAASSTALGAAVTNYTTLKAKYDNMISEDDRFVEQQMQDAREAEARSEELRQQEMHEADLKAEGLSLQNIKIEIAKQAAEISKLETEEKKINNSGTFGATVVNNITDNKKIYYVLGALAVAAIGYYMYKRLKKK